MVEAGSRGVKADGRARKRKLDAGRTSRQNVEALNLFFQLHICCSCTFVAAQISNDIKTHGLNHLIQSNIKPYSYIFSSYRAIKPYSLN